MKVFIDDFKLIRLESKEYVHHININGYMLNWLENKEEGVQLFSVDKPLRLHEVDSIDINFITYPLQIGNVTLTKAFDQKYRFRGELGALYHKTYTEFRVFSPVAKEIHVVLDGISYMMNYKRPIWSIKVPGNHHLKEYHYKVRLVDTFEIVKDPYAKGSNLISDVVVDLSKTTQVPNYYIKQAHYKDAVIYEGHVRDLTINLDVDNPGTYEALTYKASKLNNRSVLEYVKDLGMSHLQLLPVYDFEGVDDVNKTLEYNWGYNPSKYFSLEGWLSKEPNNPLDRINGYKKIVNDAHALGLGINMDVVFNHVYLFDDFPYDKLVPGYFYRHDNNNKMTDNSYCGNDIETSNYMVRKLIVDNLVYYTKEFKVDGFRFDLMGLMDVQTMKQISKALKKINPNVMLYGEGWNMDNALKPNQRANMDNANKLKDYGFFNDSYRDFIKGSLHGADRGVISGNLSDLKRFTNLVNGSPDKFKSVNQSLNYLECHDNFTLEDRLRLTEGNQEKRHMMIDFGNHLIAISKGIAFYHAGQEMYLSKNGVENSYNTGDLDNSVKWDKQNAQVDKLKELLKLRKKLPIINDDNLKYQFKTHDGYLTSSSIKDHFLIIKYQFNESNFPNLGKLVFNSQSIVKNNKGTLINKPGIYLFKNLS